MTVTKKALPRRTILRGLGATIAVAWDHLKGSCWKAVSEFKLGRVGFQDKSLVRKALMRSYLGVLATGLRTRDRLSTTFNADAKSGRIA